MSGDKLVMCMLELGIAPQSLIKIHRAADVVVQTEDLNVDASRKTGVQVLDSSHL